MPPLLLTRIPSPLGQILLVSDNRAVWALDFEDYEDRMMKLLQKRYGSVQLAEQASDLGDCNLTRQSLQACIQAYFSGDLNSLNHLPVETGGTPFQQQVWQSLRTIPAGQVITYGELAQNLNNPKAVRAVGMANSLNPIAIILPCHRVIGAKGQLTGYAGGLDRKQWLLKHEGIYL
jgi:methylated-DNA-[protein]-cysteine S-methyltransferase